MSFLGPVIVGSAPQFPCQKGEPTPLGTVIAHLITDTYGSLARFLRSYDRVGTVLSFIDEIIMPFCANKAYTQRKVDVFGYLGGVVLQHPYTTPPVQPLYTASLRPIAEELESQELDIISSQH